MNELRPALVEFIAERYLNGNRPAADGIADRALAWRGVAFRAASIREPTCSAWPRITEVALDGQMLAIFDKMRVPDEGVRDWFRAVLASQTRDAQADSRAQRLELTRHETLTVNQQDKLLNLRIAEQIGQETFARKHTELRDRLAAIKLQLDVLDRSHDVTADLAAKVFELSQTLREQWLTADNSAKRRILEIVFLNCRLEDVNLVP